MAEQQCKQINKMENKNYKKVNLTSSNLNAETLDKLRRIIPDVFLENRIDWDKLSAVLGYKVDDKVEKFGFTWAGKIEAIKNVLIPSRATLKLAKEEGIKFDESENIFIEGDNLEVLKLLQRAYFEKVKMIYIDPPYNTGGDFVYKDNFAAPLKGYLEQTGQVDGDGNKLQANRETNGRYHSDWLSMMYPRLKLAWNLLRDDGVIFISIDDNEVHHLRMLMDEIFGEENFEGHIHWRRRHNQPNDPTKLIAVVAEHIIVYSKDATILKNSGVGKLELTGKFSNPDNDKRGDWNSKPWKVGSNQNGSRYIITLPSGKTIEGEWMGEEKTYKELLADNRIYFPKDGEGLPRKKIFKFEREEVGQSATNWFENGNFGSNQEASAELARLFEGNKNYFDNPKPVKLIQNLIRLGNVKSGEIILDFFSGSGTTAQAVMEQNVEDGEERQWICVQLPEKVAESSEAEKAGYENIADITKERIKRAINFLREEVGHNRALRNFNKDTGMIGKDEEMEALCDFDNGFKVFKLEKSNYLENGFDFDPEKSEEENKKVFLAYLNKAKQAKLFEKTQEIDVVYENIIKEGLSLNAKIEEQKIAGVKVYKVTDGEKQLLICLENKISLDAVKEFRKVEYKGKIFICLDNALDDTAKANLALNVELKTI